VVLAPHPSLGRRRFVVRGVVQGVGFRPFVHALARRHALTGFVRNDGDAVLIEAEGEGRALDAFAAALVDEAPGLARVASVVPERLPLGGGDGFIIAPSRPGPRSVAIPPDVATCPECLRELFDPADRRHRHAFINCTDCGPRFTIVRDVPYDRARTTMAAFAMCPVCEGEYGDPSDRRYHAEAICCPDCGPRLTMPVEEAAGRLLGGAIVAIKGLGGYHLACDATNEDAVERLRARKHREEKPLALMTVAPETLADIDEGEAEALRSPEGPIVLCRRRSDADVALAVAPGSRWLGLMLPYTPLHHLLLADVGRPLVMTSGNRTDEPIAIGDADARERLGDIADAFLAHDRTIHRRCEDSVVRVAFPLRRSRGMTPAPLPLPRTAPRAIVAVGAQLKATFCVARDAAAYLSPHLGDVDTEDALHAFRSDLRLFLDMLGTEPEVIACDRHPDYLTTHWAHEAADALGAELMVVQHHHAHAASCLAEHRETGPVLAVVFDGTGYGEDGTLWGGEILRCDLASFERVAHLVPVPLPGGEAAIREPWRMAGSYLEAAGRPVPFERWPLVRQSLQVNAPRSSGMGRLFDAVAAILGLRERVSYEGQAAIELEHLAGDVAAQPYACRVEHGLIHGVDLLRAAHDDLAAGRPAPQIAAAFHEGVADAAAAACAETTEPRTVVLSGGTFQNVRLLTSVRRRLEAAGFRVIAHCRVPPNDAGISYGQAAVAAERI